MARILDVIPGHVEEQWLDGDRLEFRRVGDKIREVDGHAWGGVVVQTMDERRGGSHVLLGGDGCVVVEFVEVDEGLLAVDLVFELGLQGRGLVLGNFEGWGCGACFG